MLTRLWTVFRWILRRERRNPSPTFNGESSAGKESEDDGRFSFLRPFALFLGGVLIVWAFRRTNASSTFDFRVGRTSTPPNHVGIDGLEVRRTKLTQPKN